MSARHRRSACRTVAVLALAAAALCAGAPAAGALTVCLADQKPAAYADARLRALRLRVARLIVPYDAATSEPALVDAWLTAVAAAGMQPHVAFEHLRTDRCPGRPCTLPSRATYAAAVRRFIARWPQVRTYTTWNEANHESQPVAGAPEEVAGFYEELVAACPACTVVAGDVLDSGSYVQWLRRFRAATDSDPQLWGLHNYGDVTYGTTTGTDAVLAAVPGRLWIEETGGIVVLRNASGQETLPFDEARAAGSIDQAFAIAAARPRIDRMYIYHWNATATSSFDAGLVRPDGALRPSYSALVRDLAALAPAAATASPAAATTTVARSLKLTVAWSKVRRGQLLLRVRCRTSGGRCVGRLAPVVRTRRRPSARLQTGRLAGRAYRTTNAARTATLRLTVSRTLRARLRAGSTRQLRVRVVPTTPAGRAATLTLKLPRPR